MDLKKLMEDFLHLQAHRKQVKKQNIENKKMAHFARLQAVKGASLLWVQILFSTELQSLLITEINNQAYELQLYRTTIYRDEIETYRSDLDQIEISLYEEVNKPHPLLIFESDAVRMQFEAAFRHFMEYRLEADNVGDEIETYRSDHDQIEISLYEEVNKPHPLLIFESDAVRMQFEAAFRHFMEYRLEADNVKLKEVHS